MSLDEFVKKRVRECSEDWNNCDIENKMNERKLYGKYLAYKEMYDVMNPH